MKFLRFLAQCLVLVLALAVVLVAIALFPNAQTWTVQWILGRQSGAQISVDSLWARFGKVEVADLTVKAGDAVLTMPSIEARLPITSALLNRRVFIRSLVAKGWTLDLSHLTALKVAGGQAASVSEAAGSPAALAGAAVVSAETMVRFFRATLKQVAFPCDVSLDGVELEGDVIVPSPGSDGPRRVHVVVKGGGMAAGREGVFAIHATGDYLDAVPSVVALTADGNLALAMNSARTIRRVEFKADLTANGGSYPEGLALSEDVAADAGAGEGTITVTLNRGGQPLAAVTARLPDAEGRLAGTWKVDLKDPDAALFASGASLPGFAATGEGTFDADAALTQVRALGRLNVAASRLGAISPSLDRFGAVTLDTGFDASWSGTALHVDRLRVVATGTGPAVVVQTLQPFDFDLHAGAARPADLAADWMTVSVRGFPLTLLSDAAEALAFSGGNAAGEFVLCAEKDGFAVRSNGPVAASGVSVKRAGRTMAGPLDLSAPVQAAYGARGWQVHAAPLVVSSGGVNLATIDAVASRAAAADEPPAIAGTWSADLQSLAERSLIPDLSGLGCRSASGGFSVKIGSSIEVEGKIAAAGSDGHDSVTASVHATLDPGRIAFNAPMKIASTTGVSDLVVEGTSIDDGTGTRLYMKLAGKDVVLDHLRLLAAPLVASGWAAPAAGSGTAAPGVIGDQTPFWGSWVGRVTVAFGRLKAGNLLFEDVGGAVEVTPGAVRLSEGRGGFAGKRFTNVQGSISFDAAAEHRYNLQVTASLDQIDAASLFPTPASGGEPAIEGRFAIAATLDGSGNSLDDLAGRMRQEFRITSTAAIVRVFKTDIDEAIPAEKQSAASDALGRVGSGVGRFFGADDAGGSGRKSVSPAAQAVIDVINELSEIGVDQAALTAVRGSDGAIRISDIAVTAGDVRFTGQGQIGCVGGSPLRAQPLSVDLELWGRGGVAKLLSAAGLLSDRKDALGYTALNQAVHLGGTPEKIDKQEWHELLVKAARTPVAPKKGAGTISPDK